MDNRNKQQKPKKKGSGLWAFVILALIAFFNTADFDELSYRISRFFRTGRLSPDSAVFVIAAAVILAVVLLLVTLARAKKVREAKRFDGIRSFGGGTAKAHSHDQVTGYKLGAESGEVWLPRGYSAAKKTIDPENPEGTEPTETTEATNS